MRTVFVQSAHIFAALSAGALTLLISACDGCDTNPLVSVECVPGDPASGLYDPDIAEDCSNLLDDNCNGEINEGCECLAGETLTCGRDVGICESTTVNCINGHFPGCVPKTSGRLDNNCNGLDEDCNGTPDDGYVSGECWNGPPGAVFEGVSICQKGSSACVEGREFCRDQVLPEEEVCSRPNNPEDRNCNGEINDIDSGPCGPSPMGVCRNGHTECDAEGELRCVGAVYGQSEENPTPDGLDNDCDGCVDCGLTRECTTACGTGSQRYNPETEEWNACSAPAPLGNGCCPGRVTPECPCEEGQLAECRDNVQGAVDEHGNSADCGVGVMRCVNGAWDDCIFWRTEDEICDNRDNDCENGIDGLVEACGNATAAQNPPCRLGERYCSAGEWGPCEGSVNPGIEDCRNGIDDDCDGIIDNPDNPHFIVDIMFVVDTSGSMDNKITALRNALAAYAGDFDGTNHRLGLVRFSGERDVPPELYIPLMDSVGFRDRLSRLIANGRSEEWSYDALYKTMSAENPLGINWRADGYPYVVLIGDENAQSSDINRYNETSVANLALQCQLPGCTHSGDSVETFVIVYQEFFVQYDAIVYHDNHRLIDIFPPEEGHFIEALRQVFTNVCSEEQQ